MGPEKPRGNIGEGAIPAPSGHLSSGVTGLHYWAATPAAGTFSSTWLVSPGRIVTLAVAICGLPSRTTWALRLYSYSLPSSRAGVTNTRWAEVEVVASPS